MKSLLECFQMRDRHADYHTCTLPRKNMSATFLSNLSLDAPWCARFQRWVKTSTLISDTNPQTNQYFRSHAEILRERKRHVDSRTPIIHPFSKLRGFYEIYMTMALIVIMFYIPGDAAFDLYRHDEEKLNSRQRDHKFRPSNLLIKTACIVDIVMTFWTGYAVKEERRVVMAPWKIARQYVFGWYFVPDVLCAIPEIPNICHEAQRVVASMGILKIVRLPTLFYYSQRSAELLRLSNNKITLIENVLITYVMFHWVACSQILVPSIRSYVEGSINNDSWVNKAGLIKAKFSTRYIRTIYRATGYIFCIKFNVAETLLWEERLMAICTYLFGKVFVFYFSVIILHQLLFMRLLETKYHEIISQVTCYMRQRHLPVQMQNRIVQFYNYKYNRRYFREDTISNLFSERLRAQVNVDICRKLVQSVTILAQLPAKQLEFLVTHLKSEIYLANDIIIKSGAVGDCMYFLASGTVAVWTPSGKEVCHLQDGAYFGEISLVFKDMRRTANIVAIEICEILVVDRKVFTCCFRTDPLLFEILEQVARERLTMTKINEEIQKKMFLEKESKVQSAKTKKRGQ